MSHYFSQENSTIKSNPKRIAFRAHNEDFICVSDHGVFAKDNLDRGTKVLLDHLVVPTGTTTVLDLGCGYGPIGLVLAKVYGLDVDMIDVNPRALALAKTNLEENNVVANVFASDGFEQVEKSYDLIVTNPPIRVGKPKLYDLLQSTYEHLVDSGELWFVIHKNHGAKSALQFIQTVYGNVTVVGRDKGFQIIRCQK